MPASYQDSVARLLGLVDHERSAPAQPRQKRIYDLRNVERLLARLGNPHRRRGIVHVAGTKGKGSTAAMVESIAGAAGYSTGFYSSPHLHSFCERIRRDGKPVSRDRFAALTDAVWPHHIDNAADPDAGPATLFEYLTAMGFRCFAEDSVNVSVIEVGLGGRLDATNVVTPEVSVITPVSLDHMAILGDTIGEIAADKAGIIKPGTPVVVGPQFPEAMESISRAATAQSAPVICVGDAITWAVEEASAEGQLLEIHGRRDAYRLRLPLLGDFQGANAATAVGAAESLADAGYVIDRRAIIAGLESVEWPGRMEVLAREPTLVVDGAHNDHSVATLLATLDAYVPHRNLIVVAGFSRDKQVDAMVELLAQRAHRVIATRSRHPRSMRPAEIAEQFLGQSVPAERVGITTHTDDAIAEAVASADTDDLVLVTGSLFAVAEAREAVLGIEPETYPDLLPPDLR
ncbi:MAG: bifunctional folylpolyglutamate synthase/dihydrofolate synthase [Chloroflexota bacterium]|nr:bifunctional folylpolyglutamate synthase/dihydrofolate synthase [Chloroflexota bacterium]MDE2958685.1 bifunctional folylpolyglutamate synthase/dihydrofolate synthase [Chloroflexota bacterium]